MFSWAGFIGKLVELILSKIMVKHIDLELDERKNAAKAFIKFYDSLVQLEAIANYFVLEASTGSFQGKSGLYKAPLAEVAKKSDEASKSFISSFSELKDVVQIYDPYLALILSGVFTIKQQILASSFTKRMSFDVIPNPDSVFSIKSSIPSEKLMNNSLEHNYASVKQLADKIHNDTLKKIPSSMQYEVKDGGLLSGLLIGSWTEDFLLTLVDENQIDCYISANRIDEFNEFYTNVAKYLPILAHAREQFGSFLRENFSIEDLVYVK